MGLFNKITKGFSSMVGGVDAEVMQIGRPAQAEILGFNAAGTTVQMGGGLVERVCVFNVKIAMDDVAPYTAQVKQRIPEIYIPQLQGLTIVAAKVHPNDPNRIALDFNSPAPNVRMARSNDPTHTAAYILQNGAWQKTDFSDLDLETASPYIPPKRIAASIAAASIPIRLEGTADTFMTLSRPGPDGTRIHTSLGFAIYRLNGGAGAGMYEYSRRVAEPANGDAADESDED